MRLKRSRRSISKETRIRALIVWYLIYLGYHRSGLEKCRR